MKEKKVKLENINDVKEFVKLVTDFDTDIDLVADRYIIDAKSILGIFSLDLTKPIVLRVEDDEEAPKVIEALDAYIVD